MVWQDLYLFHSLQFVQHAAHSLKIIFLVGESRYQHVADPHIFSGIGKILCHIQNVVIAASGQIFVARAVHLFEIQHDQLGKFH